MRFLVYATILWLASPVASAGAQRRDDLPELTQPVNDFARVIDGASAEAMDQMIRTLLAASGDVVVVATVPAIEGYGDIREYANRLFENHGRGIGDRDKKNGLLIVLALRERRVQVEVGYGLEQWVTDGFAGETSRQYMVPEFREGRYGAGLRIWTERIIGRIAQGRNIRLDGMQVPHERGGGLPISPVTLVIILIILAMVVGRIGGGPRGGVRTWGRSGWSGWSSGVGPFGGGFGGFGGGGGGGGGFGGGFGGFGGGSSGGGGGGGSW